MEPSPSRGSPGSARRARPPAPTGCPRSPGTEHDRNGSGRLGRPEREAGHRAELRGAEGARPDGDPVDDDAGSPRTRTVARKGSPSGIRVCCVVSNTHAVRGADGVRTRPAGTRGRTSTDTRSGRRVGLNTVIDGGAAGRSIELRHRPGREQRRHPEPERHPADAVSDSVSSSSATTAPVRAVTMVDTARWSCTYASTCSTSSDARPRRRCPRTAGAVDSPVGVTKVRSTTASVRGRVVEREREGAAVDGGARREVPVRRGRARARGGRPAGGPATDSLDEHAAAVELDGGGDEVAADERARASRAAARAAGTTETDAPWSAPCR